VLKLLAHDLRWQLVNALAYSDQRVQELVDRVQRPQNLVSYHLRQLRQEHLVSERRSNADSRDVYYHLDLAHLEDLYQASGQALHSALAMGSPESLPARGPAVTRRVLFLCTQNSARSQMAEGLLRASGPSTLEVLSAGSQPAQVHPLAIETMAAMGVDIGGQQSKHLDELAGQYFDVVITVCDKMREACPAFPDATQQIHWSIADPAEVAGTEADRRAAFRQAADDLATRIRFLLLSLGHNQT
jgi:protein-tyrosine-phosphatase/DNA-binding transcriptional ArsR family regulator